METPVLTELKGPILLDHILLDIYNIYLKVFTNYLLTTSVPLRKIFFSASLIAFCGIFIEYVFSPNEA